MRGDLDPLQERLSSDSGSRSAKEREKGLLVLDTGAEGNLLDRSFRTGGEKLLSTGTVADGITGNEVPANFFEHSDLVIGGRIHLSNLPMVYSDLKTSEILGILGAKGVWACPFLRHIVSSSAVTILRFLLRGTMGLLLQCPRSPVACGGTFS